MTGFVINKINDLKQKFEPAGAEIAFIEDRSVMAVVVKIFFNEWYFCKSYDWRLFEVNEDILFFDELEGLLNKMKNEKPD